MGAKRFVLLTVPGLPVPKGRPRFGRNGRTYTPERTMEAQEALGWAMHQECQEPMQGPLVVQLYFSFRAPSRFRKKDRERMEENEAPCPTGPDLDNLTKLVLDAANRILWDDDRQVVSLEAHKTYGPEPGTHIQVAVAEEE